MPSTYFFCIYTPAVASVTETLPTHQVVSKRAAVMVVTLSSKHNLILFWEETFKPSQSHNSDSSLTITLSFWVFFCQKVSILTTIFHAFLHCIKAYFVHILTISWIQFTSLWFLVVKVLCSSWPWQTGIVIGIPFTYVCVLYIKIWKEIHITAAGEG